MERRLLWLALLVAWGGTSESRAFADLASSQFTAVVTLHVHTGYVVEGVTYQVDGLTIDGQVCRPIAAGRYPIVLFNHGGFSGLQSEWDGALCAGSANGFVVAMSSYRGEDDSQGAVEVCAGEVDDTLQLLAIVRAQPYADASRAVMFGASHGGCVTLRAVARGASVRAAVDLFGPVQWSAIYDDLAGRLALGIAGDLEPTYRDIVDRLTAATGGTPSTAAAAYTARSPLHDAAAIAGAVPDLLIIHGTDDAIIPVAQSCALASLMPGMIAHHVDSTAQIARDAPARCPGLMWSGATMSPSGWAGHRHLSIHDGAGHGLDTPLEQAMVDEALAFLVARLR